MDEKDSALLLAARGHDAGPGSVSEIHLKHLLALNLRKLRGAEHAFVPRSYILLPGDFLQEEFNSFVLDFKISQALAVVKQVAGAHVEAAPAGITNYRPEGLWGRELPTIHWEPGPEAHQPVSKEIVEVALSVIQRVFQGDQGKVSASEWIQLRSFDVRSSLDQLSVDEIERCRKSLLKLPESHQPSLLHRNFWALKPSCGQFGRGILLLDRLPEDPEELLRPIVGLSDCASSDNADGKSKSPIGPGGIYHEKQALHCVNNLLQKPAYDDSMFRMIAMELDRAERSLLGGDNLDFGNARMDGFYNVQVVQEVLRRGNSRANVPALQMMPISSEAAKECKIDRVKETAFILNKFDLNSCLPNPAHYTPGDLDFHIRDAVREGYSVFVVRGNFPKCELEEEHNHKKLLEAVQGCGRPRQTYSLFAGSGQALSSGGGGGGAAPTTAAAAPPSNDAAALRAARLARFGGGGGPAPPAPEAAAAPAAAAAPVSPEAAPAAPPAPAAPAAVPQGNPALEQLVSMGFDREQSKNALEAAKGNVEQAAELLLSS